MLPTEMIPALIDIVGRDRVLDQPEELLCHGYDSFLIESLPEAVVFPVTTEEVAAIVKLAAAHRVPVTARGAGTSVCGAPVPVRRGLVLSFTRMNSIVEINTRDRYAVVQPGVVGGDLQKALAPLGFFYPPDPGSMHISTIGGNVALNAGGPRCLKYGVTADYLLGMQVVLASGEVVRFGSRNIKDVAGYRLASLFCGSEGTLGLVTEIILRVVPQPETSRTLTVTFDDLDNCARAVSDIIGSGILPAAMELLDRMTLNAIEDAVGLGLPRAAEGMLLIEVDGIREACDREMEKIVARLREHHPGEIQEAADAAERDRLWAARRSAYGVFAKLAPDIVSEDVTVPVSKIPEMIRKINEICTRLELRSGVLAHAGDGNLHPLVPTDRTNTDEWQRVEKAFAEIFAAAAAMGGTLSGEHGIGLAKAPYLPLVMDEDSRAFMARIKRAIDPDDLLNPGKFI